MPFMLDGLLKQIAFLLNKDCWVNYSLYYSIWCFGRNNRNLVETYTNSLRSALCASLARSGGWAPSHISSNTPTYKHNPSVRCVTNVETNSDFLVCLTDMLMFYGFLCGILGCRLPEGFRCRSENSPNYLQLAVSYHLKKSEYDLSPKYWKS